MNYVIYYSSLYQKCNYINALKNEKSVLMILLVYLQISLVEKFLIVSKFVFTQTFCHRKDVPQDDFSKVELKLRVLLLLDHLYSQIRAAIFSLNKHAITQ